MVTQNIGVVLTRQFGLRPLREIRWQASRYVITETGVRNSLEIKRWPCYEITVVWYTHVDWNKKSIVQLLNNKQESYAYGMGERKYKEKNNQIEMRYFLL